MTLLVVLGFVVIATILGAVYLSLKSTRDDDEIPARGYGSRPGAAGSPGPAGPGWAGTVPGRAGRRCRPRWPISCSQSPVTAASRAGRGAVPPMRRARAATRLRAAAVTTTGPAGRSDLAC